MICLLTFDLPSPSPQGYSFLIWLYLEGLLPNGEVKAYEKGRRTTSAIYIDFKIHKEETKS
jgi:hypothetical protein